MREYRQQEQADPQRVPSVPLELPILEQFVCQKKNKKEKTRLADSKMLSGSQKPARAQKNSSPNKHLKSPGSPSIMSHSPSTLHSGCSKPRGLKSPPLADTQRFSENSLKIKHETEIRIPPVPSPKAVTNQMHPDTKLPNHGKPVNSNAPAPNASQGTPGGLGSKATGAGGHGGKSSQISPGNSGLKGSQNSVPSLGALKGKVKRERSISVDSGDQREAGTPVIDTESKDGPPRSKRRCVLERKQPYSGDEWYSGPDSEDEDKPRVAALNCTVVETALSGTVQPSPSSNPLPPVSESAPSSAPHNPTGGPCQHPDSGNTRNPSKPPSQFVAAEAVIQGRSDSIVAYHTHNVPRTKLEQVYDQKVSHAAQKGAGLQEQLTRNRPPSGTPQPQQQGQQCLQPPSSLPQEGGAGLQPLLPDMGSKPMESNGGAGIQPGGGHPNVGNAPTNPLQGPPVDPANGRCVEANNPNGNGLSKEQLEHRERSLQTLRDIERLLLRSSEGDFSMKGNCGPNGPGDGQQLMKKPEEPLQSMISQAQSLGGVDGPNMEQDPMHHQEVMQHDPMGQQVSMMMNPVNQDNLTPEQVAWRKLQEDFYEEKRRKQEQAVVQQRTMQEMMMQRPMGGMIVRGPPPPYHSKAGDQWPAGMGNRFTGPMDVPDPMQPRGAAPFSSPRFPNSQVQRVSGYGAMQNIPMEALGAMNPMQRTVRPGMAWPDDMPPMGGGGAFPQGGMPYHPGQGDPERFMNPRAREELLRQQLMEKRSMGMQRPLNMGNANTISGISQGMEMERMLQAQRQMEPGAISGMFPGPVPGDSVSGNPMGLEFVGSRGMLSPPLGQAGPVRDIDPSMGPGNLNMNMNVNMNMNMNLNVQMTPQQQMMMSQKMRAQEMMSHQVLTPEEMARVRAQNGSGMLGDPQKMMMQSPFPNHGQQGFPGGQGQYSSMSQEVNSMGNPGEMFGPEQGPMPVSSMGNTARLSHMHMTPTSNQPSNHGNVAAMLPVSQRGLGRRPSDLTININQMNSPNMGHLKSPTISQVHSPLVSSPSANLKSPQTPSQLASLTSSNTSGPIKSPQVLSSSLPVRSPASSPSRLKSPSMSVASPGWSSSPKTTLPSPVVSQGKPPMSLNSSTPLGNIEQGPIVSASRPGPGLPYNSPDSTPSQNPLSLMMSQMSKYAMPSSTPLYHDAIKTIATSDDELAPERSMSMIQPTSVSGMSGGQNPQQHLVSQSVVGPGPANSPLALGMVGQPLSHEPPASMMPSPGMMGPSLGLHEGHGPGMGVQSPMMVHPSQDSLGQGCGPQMLPQNPMVLQRMQHQPHNPLQSPGSGMQQQQQVYPPGMAMSHDDGVPPHSVAPGPAPAPSQQQQQQPQPPPPHLMTKIVPGRLVAEAYHLSGVASVLNDPELQDVIRPSASGIPEFNLSRIIPSERPSSTLQYFPKVEPQAPKAPSSNPHLMNLQSMMLEQGPPSRPSLAGQQHQQQQQVQRGLSMHIFHPGQVPGPMMARTGMPGQHGMMGNSLHQVLMSPQQSLMAQQNMMLQAKQRSLSLSGDMYGQGGHMLPPQVGVLAALPHQSMMFPQQLRQRSMSLDTPITFVPGPGNAANMPF
ncbi:B-cell CLL/lymphoma 9-like protein isoform X2 [Rhinoraja longicauda]